MRLIRWLTNYLTNQLTNQPTSKPANQQTSQPINLPTNKPISQPSSQSHCLMGLLIIICLLWGYLLNSEYFVLHTGGKKCSETNKKNYRRTSSESAIQPGDVMTFACGPGLYHVGGNLQMACSVSGRLLGAPPICSRMSVLITTIVRLAILCTHSFLSTDLIFIYFHRSDIHFSPQFSAPAYSEYFLSHRKDKKI